MESETMKSHVRVIVHLTDREAAYKRWMAINHTWSLADHRICALVHGAVYPHAGIVEFPR